MSAAHRRITLTGSVVGAAVVALDGTVLTVVQPTLQKDLHASFAQVRWTSTGYLIAVAGLLVLAGRLGDRYGHRRLFAVGMLGFGATSAGIGLASGIGTVIVLRVAQGAFGALLQPATLGMLRAAFPPTGWGCPSRCGPAPSAWRPRRDRFSAEPWPSTRDGGRPSSSTFRRRC
ncbi:MFS transporter [Streptomyces flavovirens]|uniref:MFS transporter n=1 Tax=Streptomyces flavovirens TaxID=52258 RepID=UPI003D09DD67